MAQAFSGGRNAAVAKMMEAAGILFVDRDKNALFLKRSADGDHAGEWGIPGGKMHKGESALECAVRETREETGHITLAPLVLHTRRVKDDVDFTTFLAKVNNQFIPELDNEHIGHAWAPIDSPPEPLHPGCQIALARLSMDELGIARAMAAGELTSPQ